MKIFSFKSKPYIIILASCGCILLFLSAFFIRSMHDKKSYIFQKNSLNSKESKENSSQLELNDAIITRLILENLPGDIPFSNLVVHISSDSSVKIDCEITKDALSQFLASRNAEIPPYVKFMSKLLPDSVPLSLNLRLSVNSKDGTLNLTPHAVSVNGIELTASMLPGELELNINQAINGFISSGSKKISSINISDGHIIINLSEK